MCWGGDKGSAPFPTPLSPLAAPFLRCAPDRFLLTKPNTSCTIEMPASLRSDGVRNYPGMPFGIILDSAYGFAGIPTFWPEWLFWFDLGYWGATEQKTRLRTQATSSVRSEGLLRGI